jgi:hypothetical protein
MFDAGISPDAILAVVKAEEEADRSKLKRTRKLEAARQQRQRDRDALVTSPSEPAQDQPTLFQSVPASPVPASVPEFAQDHSSRVMSAVTRDSVSPHPPSTPPPLPPGGGDEGGRAPASDCKISAQAFALADQVMDLMGIDRAFVPPGWFGLAMHLQGGFNEGWRAELVLLATQRVAANLKERGALLPYTFGYLTKPIIREHQHQQRPLPMVAVVDNPESAHAQATQHYPGGAYGASKDRFRAAHAKLRAYAEGAEPGDREGGDKGVELLRPARRERS